MQKDKVQHLKDQLHLLRKITRIVFIPVMSLVFITGVVCNCGPAFAADGNSNYSLSGAKYQLYTDKACTKKAKDLDGNNALLTTNANGSSSKLKMDPGTYYAKETTASKGYMLDTNVYTVKVTTSNTSSDPATFTSKEPPLYGEPYFRVYKTSSGSTYEGYEKFLGAEFTVKYYDVSAREDIASAKPKDQWTFVTTRKIPPADDPDTTHYYAGFNWQKDEPVSYKHDGTDKFYMANGKRVLPVGYFTIEETKAPAGYKLSDKIYYGRVYKDGTTGEAVTKVHGDITDSSHLKEIIVADEPYTVSVKKTDASDGKALAGAKMQVLRGGSVIDEWTTTAKEHRLTGIAPGNYTLRELSAPYGYDISDDVSFTVKEGADATIEMKNTPVSIVTSAVDTATENHFGCISESETITDTVKLTGLNLGRKYRVSGTLADKVSGAPLKNSDGSNVTASSEFKADAKEMTVKVDFIVDSSSFEAGTQAVVFEKLERISAVHNETVPVEIQKHEDTDDEAQTISYPGISTVAEGQTPVTKAVMAGPDAAVKDTVTYTGLLAGETYTLEGELYDKTEECLTGIKNTVTFSAASSSGTASVDFAFDAGNLGGHTLVVFETLKLGDVTLAEHKDAGDADQTVYVPGIKTSASLQKGNSEVKDEVSYMNLVPDSDYVLKGWLVDTATGEKVPVSDGSKSLRIGKKTSGETEVVLNTEKYDDMAGHSLTAFEELYIIERVDGTEKEILVAEHKDISDESQTVGIYQDLKVKKNVTGNLGDLTKVFEYSAAFTGLMPDTAYKVEGDDEKTFMSDASGKATIPIELMDDQKVTIRQLPKGAKYQITERASDHEAQFKVFSEDMAKKGARIVQAEGNTVEEEAKDISTAMETVDLFDGTVVVLWENNRDLATLTAVQSYTGIWGCATALVLAAVVTMLIKRRNYKED